MIMDLYSGLIKIIILSIFIYSDAVQHSAWDLQPLAL